MGVSLEGHLEVQQRPEHGFTHPLLLCNALVEDSGVELVPASKGVAVPPIDSAGRDVHVGVAVGVAKVDAPLLQDAQAILQIWQVDPGAEEARLCSHIPATVKQVSNKHTQDTDFSSTDSKHALHIANLGARQ